MTKKKNRECFYSPREASALDILKANRDKKLTTLDLVELIYKGDEPFNARQSVVGILGQLARKVKMNEEGFQIKRTQRKGPVPVAFWIEGGQR